MDTLAVFVSEFEAAYEAVAGTEYDPYKDIPEFDDYDFEQSSDEWEYNGYYA